MESGSFRATSDRFTMRSRKVRSDVSARGGTSRSSMARFSFVHSEFGAGTAMPLASSSGGASSADT